MVALAAADETCQEVRLHPQFAASLGELSLLAIGERLKVRVAFHVSFCSSDPDLRALLLTVSEPGS